MNDQEKIIKVIKDALEPQKFVHAFWLEGSTVQGHGDEYSDLDVWLEVNIDKIDETYRQVKKALNSIGPIDLEYEVKKDNDQRHIIYHIKDTSEFLTIDVNVQPFPSNSSFDEGIDVIKIIFNKNVEFKFYKPKSEPFNEEVSKKRILDYFRSIKPNVLKNVRRNKPLEAKIYYDYILDIVIKFLRRKYKLDAKMDYGKKHIYRDLPKDIVEKIDYFTFVQPGSIENKLDELGEWIKTL